MYSSILCIERPVYHEEDRLLRTIRELEAETIIITRQEWKKETRSPNDPRQTATAENICPFLDVSSEEMMLPFPCTHSRRRWRRESVVFFSYESSLVLSFLCFFISCRQALNHSASDCAFQVEMLLNLFHSFHSLAVICIISFFSCFVSNEIHTSSSSCGCSSCIGCSSLSSYSCRHALLEMFKERQRKTKLGIIYVDFLFLSSWMETEGNKTFHIQIPSAHPDFIAFFLFYSTNTGPD